MLASWSVKEFRLRIQEHRPIKGGAKAPKVRNENAGNGSPPQGIAPALFRFMLASAGAAALQALT